MSFCYRLVLNLWCAIPLVEILTCLMAINHLTLWNLNKMAAVLQTIFSNAFSSMKIVVFWLEFHWNSFPIVQLTIFKHWVRKWLGTEQAASHYLNQRWLNLLMLICISQAWSKWPTYIAVGNFKCSSWINIFFFSYFYKNFTEVFPKVPIDDKPVLIKVMAWCWTCNKPFNVLTSNDWVHYILPWTGCLW